MLGKLSGWDDTIVALATPNGVGAIGVIRLSGDKAITIADDMFPSKALSHAASHTLSVGFLKDKNVVLDQVVIALFRSPASYTGEDVVEISCHGSSYIIQRIIQSMTHRGARLAKPGEFTQRAFLHGKIDLTQAEAVADLILSNTEATRKFALHNIRGGFSVVLKQLRDQLLTFSALIELELDFSQEDVAFADRAQLYALVNGANATVDALINSFTLGNVIKHGVSVAIIGRPNAGKSTLLNTLLNEDRAIVSDIAGTTRDTIEEVLNIDGIRFRLIDTAGIRQHTRDQIETIGVARSLEKMNTADVVLYLFDVMEMTAEELKSVIREMEEKKLKCIYAGNKSDQLSKEEMVDKYRELPVLLISAAKVQHIETLKQELVNAVISGSISTDDAVVTNARHYDALSNVKKSLQEMIKGLDNNIPGDLLSSDIRTCLHYLGEITGEVTNEDQLDYIFSKFCIGK